MKWLGYFALGAGACVCLSLILFVVILVYLMSVKTYEELGLIGFLIPVGIIVLPTILGWCLWKLIKS